MEEKMPERSDQKLAKSTAAFAGLAGATSTVVGVAAAAAAPTGIGAVGVFLGLSAPPLIVTAAPVVAGVAATVAATAGAVRFYSWARDGFEGGSLNFSTLKGLASKVEGLVSRDSSHGNGEDSNKSSDVL
jgi:hypothetical protein